MDVGFGTGSSGGVVRTTQNVTPTTGTTTVIPEGVGLPRSHLLWATPAGTMSAWTVQLPSDAGSILGDRMAIGSSRTITAFSIAGGQTVYNAPNTLNGGDLFVLEKISTNTWAHEG